MFGFPETGQRNVVAAVQYARDGRSLDRSDSVTVELGTMKLLLAELGESVKDGLKDCKQY